MMERLDITVLDREYSLACAPDQKEGLLAAVRASEYSLSNTESIHSLVLPTKKRACLPQYVMLISGCKRSKRLEKLRAMNALLLWPPFRLPLSCSQHAHLVACLEMRRWVSSKHELIPLINSSIKFLVLKNQTPLSVNIEPNRQIISLVPAVSVTWPSNPRTNAI